jgi:uncharacterized membrane protein
MTEPENILRSFEQDVVRTEHRVLEQVKRIEHFRHEHPPVRNVNQEFQGSFTPLEQIALFVTNHVGTFGFFLIILAWTILWLGWNTLGPAGLRFDPAPAFVFWLFISNMIQIMLMPLIMVGQNLASRHAEIRGESDFEINQKAEKEVEVILIHLEQQAAQMERQGELILEILKRLSAKEGVPPVQGRPTEGGAESNG